jgi:tRNA-intron endonuclease
MRKEKEKEKSRESKQMKQTVEAIFEDERVITENSDKARVLYEQSRYGSPARGGKIQLSLLESLYLIEKGKIIVLDKRNKEIDFENFLKKAKKKDKKFWIRYCVFKDIRERGYIIKTALKFGADFRVYARGVKPGEDHAKWIVYPVHETEAMTWHEFAAKNRVAHSTKKRLMVGVVDEEGDVSYWEIKWLKP